jgi:hypothetical protein
MIASTFKQYISSLDTEDDQLEHPFPDLLLKKFSYQYSNLPSSLQVESKLSAPPPWKLEIVAPVDGEVTIGYDAFVARNS